MSAPYLVGRAEASAPDWASLFATGKPRFLGAPVVLRLGRELCLRGLDLIRRQVPGGVAGLGGARELLAQVRAKALPVDGELLGELLGAHFVTSFRAIRRFVHALTLSQRGANTRGRGNVYKPLTIVSTDNIAALLSDATTYPPSFSNSTTLSAPATTVYSGRATCCLQRQPRTAGIRSRVQNRPDRAQFRLVETT